MRLAVCDDNIEFANQLRNYIEKCSEKNTDIDTFSDGEEFAGIFKSGRANYDAVFLDIDLGTSNGIDVGNTIREYDSEVIIVFVSNYTRYMQESFVCAPFRFLVKPVNEDDVKTVMSAVLEKIGAEKKTFIFNEKGSTVRLFSKDIIFFESKAHCLYVHTADSNYRIVKTLSGLCDEIGNNEFCRVHNSFAVNMNYIKEIKSNEVLLHSGDTVPLGRKYKKDFMMTFLDFKERKYFI